jgi:hypothetical protein
VHEGDLRLLASIRERLRLTDTALAGGDGSSPDRLAEMLAELETVIERLPGDIPVTPARDFSAERNVLAVYRLVLGHARNVALDARRRIGGAAATFVDVHSFARRQQRRAAKIRAKRQSS